jgi:tetratricopeptide (TPR) repeat protein
MDRTIVNRDNQLRRTRRRAAESAARGTPADAPTPRGFVRQLLVLSAIGLTVRLVYIWQIRHTPFFDVLMGDARGYDAWARQIAAGDWVGQNVFYQAPLYPYFLGSLYAIAGHSLLMVRVCQAAIATASCVLLALAVRRAYSERAGFIAGLALALYAPAVFFDGLLQKSVLDVFFVCLVVWIVSGLIDAPARRSRWFWLGVSLGGLALTRENALVIVAAILLFPPGGARMPASERLRLAGVLALGVFVVLLPVAARNRAVGGEWHLTTSQFGPNLYIGNNPDADGTYAALREGRGSQEYERQDATEIAEAAAGRRLTPGEVSSYWVQQTTDFVRSQPGAWLTLVARKFALLWNRTEVVDTESQASYEDVSVLLRSLALVFHFGVLVPLAVFGIIATWRERSRSAVYYAIAAAYAASVVMFYVSARYRLPLVPLLIAFAAAGVASLPDFVRTAGGMRIAGAAATIIAVSIVTNRPLLSADLMRATTETNLGVALQADGRQREAETHYRRAISIQPDYVPAHVNLGTALVALNRPKEAIEEYERAIALGSAGMDVDGKLGNALLQAGDAAGAAAYFQRSIAAGRRSAETFNNLGVALLRTGRQIEAIAAYRESLHINPNNGDLYFRLGSILLERGEFAEAIDALRAGLALAPESPQGHNNLGGALAASGRTFEAIVEFEQALRLNPNLVSARRNLELLRSGK